MEQDQNHMPLIEINNNEGSIEKEENKVQTYSEISKLPLLFKKTLKEYNKQLVDSSDQIETEEELIRANVRLLKQIITLFKDQAETNDEVYLAGYVTKLKLKADEDFNNFIKAFREKLNHQEQDDDYEEIYHLVHVKEEANNNSNRVTDLDDSVSSVCDLGLMDTNVSSDYIPYIRLYRNRLKNSIHCTTDEMAINEIHQKLRSEAIQKFPQKDRESDVQVFGQYLDQCFTDFKIKLFLIQSKMEIYLKEGKSFYNQKMEDHLESGKYYSEQRLSEIHNKLKNNSINKMRECFEVTDIRRIDIDLNEWTQELTKSIEKDFKGYTQTNELNKLKFEKEIGSKIKDYSEKYEGEIHKLIDTVDSPEQFKIENKIVKAKLIEKFKEENFQSDQDTLKPHLITLKGAFHKSFEKSEDLLGLMLDKRSMDNQRVAAIIREDYKQKMQSKFEIKRFYFKQNFFDIHESIVTEIGSKHRRDTKFVSQTVQDIFVEFNDLNARNTPKVPAIGIDLGTTNSVVAYFNSDYNFLTKSTVIMPNELGKDVTPSVVSFRDNKEVVVGDIAKEEEGVYIHNTIHSVKRLIGQSFDDLNRSKHNKKFIDNLDYKLIEHGNKPKISVKVDGVESVYFPEEISAKVLQKMKLISEKYLEGFDVKKVVITVPAYFNESQKEATRHAGFLAGLKVLGIINEPTAAAIAFKVDKSVDIRERTILIFDFGGGTLDVAIVRLEKGDIITKAVKGDNYLGGEDIDNNLFDYCLRVFCSKSGLKLKKRDLKDYAIHRLRIACENCKIKLSSINSTSILIKDFHESLDLKVEMTRSQFNDINKAVFERAISLVKETLKDSKIKDRDIDDIVLVGGSTRIPRIQEMLSKLFNNRALNHTINPDLSVAVGAAIHAATLNGQSTQNQLFQFTDVTPKSYGVEKFNKELFVIIPRNTKLPTKVTQKFVTHENNQESVEICVFEGEEKISKNNHLLGKFKLFGIPPGKKGTVSIEVTFAIEEDGILRVSAECDKIVGNLEIKDHKSRLTEEQLQELVEKSKFEYLKDHGSGKEKRCDSLLI